MQITVIIHSTVAYFNRQNKSCVNLLKVVLNCLKFPWELELMIIKFLNYRGVIGIVLAVKMGHSDYFGFKAYNNNY